MSNPVFNFNFEDLLGKIEESLKPIADAFEDRFAPEAETDAVEYDVHYTDLIYALQAKIEAIEKSEALTIDQKIDAQIALYSIWAGVIS